VKLRIREIIDRQNAVQFIRASRPRKIAPGFGDIPADTVFRYPVEECAARIIRALRDRIGAEGIRLLSNLPGEPGKGKTNDFRT
jgi:hypothetical protein